MASYNMDSKTNRDILERSARIMEKNDGRRNSNLTPDKLLDSLNSPNNKANNSLFDMAAGVIASTSKWVYEKFADQEEHIHLLKNKQEIDNRIRNSGGVLFNRLTRMEPDSRGEFIPVKYIGIEIVGDGANEVEARLEYNNKMVRPFIKESDVCTIDNPFGSPMSCRTTNEFHENSSVPVRKVVCTPMNPTGGPIRSQAHFSEVPSYTNAGYRRQVAYEVEKVYEVNPKNISQVNFGSKASPLQARAYLRRELFFISEGQWKKINLEYL